MKGRTSSSLIALLFAATLVAPATASAAQEPQAAFAPGYVSSEPSDGEMLDQAPERVEVTFDEPLDQSSLLTVTDECGRKVDDGNLEVQATTMSVGIALKPIGEYFVEYFAKGVGGVTGQESGTFDFMVHSGPSCGKKQDDGANHGNHGGGNGGGDGSGNHQGGGDDGSAGHGDHSGAGDDGGRDHSSMGHSSGSGRDHSAMNHSSMGSASHGSGSERHGSGKHGSSKDGSGRHGSGRHGSGKHGKAGAHGLLDILNKNKDDAGGALAAGPGPGGLPAPDGQAVALALALSLLRGVVGGWFLRVSGAR